MKTLLFVVQLIPSIISLVKAIEESIPDGGFGSEKLASVKEILTSTYDGVSEVWPYIEKAIGVIVALFNKTGVFTTKEQGM